MRPQPVCVVCVPRDSFSLAPDTLRALAAHTAPDVPIVVVDGGSPPPWSARIARLADELGMLLVRTEHLLTPNEARNLGVAQTRADLVVFVDNDVIVSPGWLAPLVACARDTGADVVCPLILWGDRDSRIIHHAGGEARIVDEGGVRRLHEVHLHKHHALQDVATELCRQPVETCEFHCVLVRRAALDRLGPLDERFLSLHEHVDLCMAVRASGGEVWFEPGSIVNYIRRPPFGPGDRPYFLLRWSDAWNRASQEHMVAKWRLHASRREPHSWVVLHRRRAFEPWAGALRRRLGARVADALVALADRVAAASVVRRLKRLRARNATRAPRVVRPTVLREAARDARADVPADAPALQA